MLKRHTISLLARPEVTWGKTENLKTIFESLLIVALQKKNDKSIDDEEYKAIMSIITPLEDVTLNLNRNDKDCRNEWWDGFHKLFLSNLAQLGKLCLKYHPDVINNKLVMDGFLVLHNEWLSKCFPHVGALRKCYAKKALRIIYVPRTKSDEQDNASYLSADDLAISRLSQKAWSYLTDTCGYDKDTIVSVLPFAFDLFAEMTGGEEHVEVCISTGIVDMPDKSKYDVGQYDQNFIVRSIQQDDAEDDESQNERVVTWYYLNPKAKEDEYPSEIGGLLQILRADKSDNPVARKIGTDETESTYSRFKKVFSKMPT